MPPTYDTKVITGKVRISYAYLFEPRAMSPEEQPTYQCVLLVPKSDKKTIQDIRRAQNAAIEAGKNRLFGGKVPSNWADTVHDGDVEGDLDNSPEYAGHYFLSVWSRYRPGVVDKSLRPILDSTEVYSGCYVRASINAFAYSTSGKKGVSFGLNHIQKLDDGDMLGGRSRAEDDFADFAEDSADLL